jgi:hypothetical protein
MMPRQVVKGWRGELAWDILTYLTGIPTPLLTLRLQKLGVSKNIELRQ